MKKIIPFLYLIMISSVLVAQSSETEFELIVKKHLKSIDEKNFENFSSTLTDSDKLNLIMPNGVHLKSKSQILDFTQAWFAETTWEMKYTILEMKETSEMGFVLLMVNYSDVDQDNNPYSLVYYLNLIFEKENGKWGLVHDQNTMCYDKNK